MDGAFCAATYDYPSSRSIYVDLEPESKTDHSLSRLASKAVLGDCPVAGFGGTALLTAAAASLVTLCSLPSPTMAALNPRDSAHIMSSYLFAPQRFSDACKEMSSFYELEDGWDGIGSLAPTRSTIGSALAFLAALPGTLPAPEAGATADGDAEWYWRTPKGSGTVSFIESRMTYFFRNGPIKTKDAVEFDMRSIPSELLSAIASL
ncbi:hypothetical protein C8J30_12421 [Rhodobacter viridis]|uniref:Uncharacterized protein n=2 Tax=Rhodobacter viridis TaxID=1054202 RepID=A0A318U4A7_9RHOB|nr:hypothetical protein C8J30_12421 [Rhodobacter viridis]